MMRTFLIVVVLAVSACTQPAATPVVPAVNGQPINQAKPCDSYIGQVLTKADETATCTDPNGTGDSTYIQPASATVCDNGMVYIFMSATVSGIEGQVAKKGTVTSLDRSTCTGN